MDPETVIEQLLQEVTCNIWWVARIKCRYPAATSFALICANPSCSLKPYDNPHTFNAGCHHTFCWYGLLFPPLYLAVPRQKVISLHFMICHSKKCHRPRTSSCHKNSEVKQVIVADVQKCCPFMNSSRTSERHVLLVPPRSRFMLVLVPMRGGTTIRSLNYHTKRVS